MQGKGEWGRLDGVDHGAGGMWMMGQGRIWKMGHPETMVCSAPQEGFYEKVTSIEQLDSHQSYLQ